MDPHNFGETFRRALCDAVGGDWATSCRRTVDRMSGEAWQSFCEHVAPRVADRPRLLRSAALDWRGHQYLERQLGEASDQDWAQLTGWLAYFVESGGAPEPDYWRGEARLARRERDSALRELSRALVCETAYRQCLDDQRETLAAVERELAGAKLAMVGDQRRHDLEKRALAETVETLRVRLAKLDDWFE